MIIPDATLSSLNPVQVMERPSRSFLAVRMKAVQPVCAGAFVGVGGIVAGHVGLGYPLTLNTSLLQVPFVVR